MHLNVLINDKSQEREVCGIASCLFFSLLLPDVVYCPRQSCGSPVIWDRSGTAAMCTVCSFAFCVACKKTYHGTEDCQGKKILTENDAQQTSAGLPQSQGTLEVSCEYFFLFFRGKKVIKAAVTTVFKHERPTNIQLSQN